MFVRFINVNQLSTQLGEKTMLTNRKMFSYSSIVVLVIVMVAVSITVSGCMLQGEVKMGAAKSGCDALTNINANKGAGVYGKYPPQPPQPTTRKSKKTFEEHRTRGARDL